MNHTLAAALLTACLTMLPLTSRAHCDTLEGPVITSARAALANGNVTPVLKWIQPADEPAVRAAFDQTLAVRKLSKDAALLADTWFFETLVRIHRAGEGAPFTGLKSEPTDPRIAAADAALESGKSEALVATTTGALQAKLLAKLERVRALKEHADHSVEHGRAYVAAYVDYVHFAEKLAVLASDEAHDAHGAQEHAH